MKTISIEQVTNGWIVRPFIPGCGWAGAESPAISVFNKMEDMQAELPKFFEMSDPFVPDRTITITDDMNCGEKK